jgi:RecJ-like exonuclease
MNKKFDYKKNSNKSKKFAGDFKEFVRNVENPTQVTIDKISAKDKGESFSVFGSVDKVVQTGGPTIFYITDGTGTLALKAFEGAGVRSYPHVDVGDVIKASIKIEEYNDELEGEVSKIWKLQDKDKKEFLDGLEKIERDRAKVAPIPFLADSPVLEKLKERMIVAATAVRLAVIQNRPIIIRHHNDTDGYSSGYALERAILPLIEKQHASVKAAWEFFTRAPCDAPMYELDDSIRDTARSLSNEAKFSNKIPLVLIVDTGSGEEDLLGILQGKVHGEDFIVVDHHRFDKDVISEHTIANINPCLVGEDGAAYSAGMLCTELARLINPDPNLNITQIPAMAGLADRVDNPKVMDKYLELAKEKGYTKEMLREIACVIDFVSSRLRFMEAREYVEVLFGEPMKKQKALVDLLAPYIRGLEAKGLQIAKSAVKTQEINGITLQSIEVEKTFPRGFYPKTGRVVSLLHDNLQETKKTTKLVTIGILPDAITIRATDEADFSVQDMIKHMHKEVPEAFVEGGGHKNAGSIRFIPTKQEKVLELFKKFVGR